MPGRKASSALPERSAKNAAIPMPTRLFSTNCGLERCTIRTTSSTTAAPIAVRDGGLDVVDRDVGAGERDRGEGGLQHAADAAERLAQLRADGRLDGVVRGRLRAPGAGCRLAHAAIPPTVVSLTLPPRCSRAAAQLVSGIEHDLAPVLHADQASARSMRPGSIPAILRRPSQTRSTTSVPSYSSASSAGAPPRGRRVTVRSVPATQCRRRAAQSEIGVAPSWPVVFCSSSASSSALLPPSAAGSAAGPARSRAPDRPGTAYGPKPRPYLEAYDIPARIDPSAPVRNAGDATWPWR